MTKTNGNIIGPYQTYSSLSAGGVNSLFDHYNYKLLSKWPYPNSVQVSLSTTSLNETTNKDLVVTLNTTGYDDGSQFTVTAVNVSNFSSSDMNPYNGTVTLAGDVSSATGNITLSVDEDFTDETPDTETFKVEVRGPAPATTLVATSGNVTISDTSTVAPALTVSFYESAYGTDIGAVNVLVCEMNSLGTSILSTTSVYTRSAGSNGVRAWYQKSGSNYPNLSSGTKYRICWHHYKNNSGFDGDYAIDDVTISGTTFDFTSSNGGFLTTQGADYSAVDQAFLNAVAVITSTSASRGRWNRDTGGTPSTNTGPSSGNGGTGYFLYTEASSPNTTPTNFWLFSPQFTA